MNYHDPDMAAGGKVVLLTGPFGAPERAIALDRPMAIAEIIAAHDLAFRLPTIAVMDGEPVLRGCWAVRIVRPGDVLAFVAVPRGGGDGAGQGKQVAGMIAALALTVAAPMLGGWVAGAMFGGSALAANLVTAAVMLGGGLLLNALFPPPQQVSAETEQVYSVSAANNQTTPLEPLPVLYGELEFAPRHASRPYSEYVGNDQYLYQLLHVTAGMATVKRIKIGETLAWTLADGYSASFSDLEFEIIQPGQPITLFPANVVTAPEVSGQIVPDPAAVLGPFTVNAAGTMIGRLAVDFAFPGGLWKAANKGVASNSIALRAQYRAIDAAGAPLGGWSNLFAETISAATRTPQRMSRAADVAPGRYEVQFLADQAFDPDDGNAINRVAWTGLRGYLTDFVTPPNTTLLAMKIRANEQLSQFSANQIRVLAERHLPVWNGAAWVLQPTRSIAWAAADLLMNADYSIGLGVHLLDLAQLSALAATWASRGDTFNAIFDRNWTVQDALRAVLRAGRTQPVRMAGRVGFVRLEPKLIKRAMFTARNVVRGSFSHKLVLFDEEKPDHVVGSYIDSQTWRTQEVVGALATVGSDLPQKVEWFGITDHDQAWRETVTEAAVNAYAREFVNFTAEWEGKLLVRGEPILVQHPFIEGVETVSLVARGGDKLTIDRDPSVASDGDLYVVLRGKNGREWGPCRVETLSGRDLTLDAADRAIVEAQMGGLAAALPRGRSERAHVLLCAGETRPFNGLVVSAVPSASGKVDILAVIDAPEVYLADATEVTPSPWTPPTLPPQNPARPVLLGLYAQLRPGIAQLELDAMWQPSAGVIGGYVAEVSYDEDSSPEAGKTWTPVYAGMSNRFTVPVLPQKLVLRVAAVGVLQGPWTKRVFAPGEVPTIVIGPMGPDDLTPELREVFDDVQAFMDEEVPAILDELEDIGNDLDALAGAPQFVYGTDYAAGDLVRYLDGIYRATGANTNVLPTDAGSWDQVGEYNSVAGTVIGFTARFEQVETNAEIASDRIVQTTRDTRRIQNALMAAAMLNSEQGANQTIANADQLAASASVSETIRTEVSRVEDEMGVRTTALAEQINVVQSQVANDVAQAISSVTTQVQNVDGRVTSQASALDLLRAALGGDSSEVQVKWEAVAAPSGYAARYVIRCQVNSDGQLRQASIFIDVPANAALPARIGFSADNIVFFASDGTPLAVFTGDGKFRSTNGAYVLDLITGDVTMTRGEIRSPDGKFLISPSLKRISIST